MYDKIKYLVSGDSALVIEFGNNISKEIHNKVRAMKIAIESNKVDGIIEITPTYRSLMIHYNPLEVGYSKLVESIKSIENRLSEIEIPIPKVIEIPVLYGGEFGPDIKNVATHNGISVEEVIRIHTSKEYLIYMLGFTPGFPYLGGMDNKIATPRLKIPRTKISSGSVGIAGSQTGIYPVDSPGGWQIIGRTPLKLYDGNSEKPILLNSGDYLKFVQIKEENYREIEEAIEKGEYKHMTYPKERSDR